MNNRVKISIAIILMAIVTLIIVTPTKSKEPAAAIHCESRIKENLASKTYSQKAMINELKQEGYSEFEIAKSIDKMNINWNEQAQQSAINYRNKYNMGKETLIKQLINDGFTFEQAKSGLAVAYKY